MTRCCYCFGNHGRIDGDIFCSRHSHDAASLGPGAGYTEGMDPWSMTPHTSRAAIHVALTGRRIYRIGQRTIVINPGNFIILNAGTEYTCQCAGTTDQVATLRIEFTQAMIRHAHDPVWEERNGDAGFHAIIEKSVEADDWMRATVGKVCERISAGRPVADELYVALAHRLAIINVESLRQADRLRHARRATRLEIYRRLTAAREYMEMNYDSNLRLDELSRVACLSKHHFKRLFKQAFECAPHQYLTSVRINRALQLLKESSLPVSEVCEYIGFGNASSFIRLFRTATGVTPMHYRAMAA